MGERKSGPTKTLRKTAAGTREACAITAARMRVAVERAEQVRADDGLIALLREAEKEALSAYAQAASLDNDLAAT